MAQEDTLVSGVAGRYASALFSLAQDDRQTEAVARDLGKLDALIAESPDLQRLVRSPVFSSGDQLKALNVILEREGVTGIAANFVRSGHSQAPPLLHPRNDRGLPQAL